MSRLIDLSVSLGHPDLAVVPNFPPVEYWQFHEHATHGRQNSAVKMAIHQGTHIDAPSHFVNGGTNIDEMPLETFCGRAIKIDMRANIKFGNPITRKIIKASAGFDPKRLDGSIAVSWTGWAEKSILLPAYYETNPFLDKEACNFLCDCGMKSLCMDHPIDPGVTPDFVPDKEDCPGHRTVLGRGVPLIEHVINLETFEEAEFEMFAFPIKCYKLEGAPVRVVARVG